ncbi:MAG: hypothetical protein J6R32_03570 [Bacteroidales bacterium]|nr:hypothetical protein [Bacteroidales bacterium]
MKKLFKMMLAASLMVVMVSCGSTKNVTKKNGNMTSGVEMVEDLSADGTRIEQVAYRWWLGMGEANVEKVAIRNAESDARRRVSETINSLVTQETKGGEVQVNGNVEEAIKTYWEQKSAALTRGCAPFGEYESEFDEKTGKYKVKAKVGIRGDKYVSILDGTKDA